MHIRRFQPSKNCGNPRKNRQMAQARLTTSNSTSNAKNDADRGEVMAKQLVVQPHLCSGCRACEMACAFTHGNNGQPGKSRCLSLTVATNEYVPMLCMQCDFAACIQVCPANAIKRHQLTSIVQIDQKKCVKCMACTVACPFGNMHFDAVNRAVVKCDMCEDHGNDPRCAMFCPTKCLSLE